MFAVHQAVNAATIGVVVPHEVGFAASEAEKVTRHDWKDRESHVCRATKPLANSETGNKVVSIALRAAGDA